MVMSFNAHSAGIDERFLHMQAGLHNRAVIAHRFDASIERSSKPEHSIAASTPTPSSVFSRI